MPPKKKADAPKPKPATDNSGNKRARKQTAKAAQQDAGSSSENDSGDDNLDESQKDVEIK